MFSGRTPSELSPSRLALVLARVREAGELLDLTESNPTRAGFVFGAEAFANAMSSPRALQYEPDPCGWIGARQAVARYYGRRGVEVDPSRIVLTASTSEAYSLIFKLLCNPGDEVLIPSPSYPLFEHLAAADCVRPVPYRLSLEHRWRIDAAEIRRACSDRTRAIIVVSPNNPTGSVATPAEVGGIRDVCREHRIALVWDEVFVDYPLEIPAEGVGAPFEAEGVLSFTLNGLSKVAGLPQVKAGWVVVDGPDDVALAALNRLEFLSDLYLSVGTPVQRALPDLLEMSPTIQADIRRVTATNLATLRAAVAGTAIDVLPVEAGWSVCLRVPRLMDDASLVEELLVRAKIYVQPGYFYDFEREGIVVASLLTPPATFAEGIRRLGRTIHRHAGGDDSDDQAP